MDAASLSPAQVDDDAWSFATEPSRANPEQCPLSAKSDQNGAAPRMTPSAISDHLHCSKEHRNSIIGQRE
jgi:hypothetical protein